MLWQLRMHGNDDHAHAAAANKGQGSCKQGASCTVLEVDQRLLLLFVWLVLCSAGIEKLGQKANGLYSLQTGWLATSSMVARLV